MHVLFVALILGIVEGLTEFLPISSTGHLILAGGLLAFDNPMFMVVIQLGAILAVCVLFFGRITRVLADVPHSLRARRALAAVLIGFLPAAVIGALFHRVITDYLFSPWVVCASLFLGGIAILVIERHRPEPRVHAIEDFTPSLALKIGFAQVLAMIPGVSRSGATILGAVLFRVDRPAAAEYSFLLAIPTMLGATSLELYQNRNALQAGDFTMIAVGFAAAFVSALLVVRWFVAFVARHGFGVFGWYRIGLAVVMLGLLLAGIGRPESPQARSGQTTGISKVPITTTMIESGNPSRQ